ncbi:MAG: hypothetical protein O9267_05315 [Flavobacterium sp.]|uniref:hypothetical protein n=1 Tax=Flavobacterium sp. TaxID=239 RepID=UPI0022CA821D|nr:hypothetical protein [Flavobacterium sp.]MCZ8197003.1 hypothetical protein [Flavobacterium sp.]
MEILKLSEIIGQEIVELKFHYLPENEYGLQSFHSYIKLKNETIIGIPNFDDNEYLNLDQENLNYYKTMFETGQPLNHETSRQLIIGQKITDFYFCYYENEIDFDFSAFIKLSNNYYLSEHNFGPIGITDVDLILFDEKRFNNEIERLKNINVDVRSFSKTNHI